ncbi:MAG: class I SAM-dependent methyltransferase [Bacteroidetes bacterium]|nr:class I SAM-dependent methyltransferase [Bacteroidota bacterium]
MNVWSALETDLFGVGSATPGWLRFPTGVFNATGSTVLRLGQFLKRVGSWFCQSNKSGCGTGANSRFLREAVGSNGRVIGIGLSGAMLVKVRQKADRAQ